jgi:hypothetical protein
MVKLLERPDMPPVGRKPAEERVPIQIRDCRRASTGASDAALLDTVFNRFQIERQLPARSN